jgi:hypothetical protein
MSENSSVAWGFMPSFMRDQLRRRLDWERYLVQARALGYSEREARIVVAGVYQVAKKIPPHAVDIVDILAEAREVLAVADFGPPTPNDPPQPES